jgi:hypothetical protein
MTETEMYAKLGLAARKKDIAEAFSYFKRAFSSFIEDTKQLKLIEGYEEYALALSILIEDINDLDDRIKIAGVSYYFFSKAIQEAVDRNERGAICSQRIYFLRESADAFAHILSAFVPVKMVSSQFFYNEMSNHQYKMEMADFQYCDDNYVESVPYLYFLKELICHMVQNGSYGQDATIESIVEEGELLHDKMFKHLEKKILVENCLVFN